MFLAGIHGKCAPWTPDTNIRAGRSSDQSSSAINGRQRLLVKTVIDVFLGFRHRWFHQTGDLAQLDHGLNAFHVDLAAWRKAESRAQAFDIHSFGSGFVVAILGEKDSYNFLLILRIRYPIGGPNHRADETHEQLVILIGPVAPRRAEPPRVVLDVVFGLGEDFEAAFLNLIVGEAHHGA